MRFPFIGQTYSSRSLNANAQKCVNLFPEIEKGGKNVAVLYGTPGLELFVQLAGEAIRRGKMLALGDFFYAVAHDKLYKVNAIGTAIVLGTLNTTSGSVSMAHNGTQIIVVDGDYGYIYNTGTEVFAEITDPDFPGADTVTFMDGYFIFNKPNTKSFMITGLYDGTTVDALDIASAEGAPDNILAIVNDHRELWLYGEKTTEVWYNSGNADFPFDRMDGVFIESGLAAPASVIKGDNATSWISSNEYGHGTIVRAEGYTPKVISTRAIEEEMRTYSSISDAFGWIYSVAGHVFHVWTFPSGNATWVYDAATKMWHKWSSYNGDLQEQGRHRADSHVFFNGKHYVGDYQTGKIYELKMDVYTDNGDPIIRKRACQHLSSDEKRTVYHKLQIVLESGVGLTSGQGSDPQAMLRMSKDGGHTWSAERWVSFGKKGEYKDRVLWRRLGFARDMVFEVTVSDPVPVVIIAATLNGTQARH